MLIPSEVFLTKASVCAGAPTSAASAERVSSLRSMSKAFFPAFS